MPRARVPSAFLLSQLPDRGNITSQGTIKEESVGDDDKSSAPGAQRVGEGSCGWWRLIRVSHQGPPTTKVYKMCQSVPLICS